jgi:hypothetical protein
MTRLVTKSGRVPFHSFWAVFLSTVFLIASTGAVSAAPGGRTTPYKLPPNLLEHFKSRYGQVDDSVIANLQETPDGPLGQIDLTGKIFTSVDVRGMTTEQRSRTIARSFIEKEAVLFDLDNPGGLKETGFSVTQEGTAVLHYQRFVGSLPLRGMFIRIEVSDEGAITRVHANLTPVPSALQVAVGRRTLEKDEIKNLVQHDLIRGGKNTPTKVDEPALEATWRPPYVIWSARGRVDDKPSWAYDLDAFTGEILNKLCTAVNVRYTPGRTPCD